MKLKIETILSIILLFYFSWNVISAPFCHCAVCTVSLNSPDIHIQGIDHNHGKSSSVEVIFTVFSFLRWQEKQQRNKFLQHWENIPVDLPTWLKLLEGCFISVNPGQKRKFLFYRYFIIIFHDHKRNCNVIIIVIGILNSSLCTQAT